MFLGQTAERKEENTPQDIKKKSWEVISNAVIEHQSHQMQASTKSEVIEANA